MFVSGKSETRTRAFTELCSTLAVSLGSARDFGNPFADERLGDDHLWATIFICFSVFDGSSDGC